MILVDAGPLVALVDRADQHHAACAAALEEIDEPLGTVWPALTEAMYLLSDVPGGQDALLRLVEARPVEILLLDVDDLSRIRELIARYHDLPMDLADAALVRVAEREDLDTIFTVDRRDFSVYRAKGRIPFRILPVSTADR